jgi:mycofactocin glycosyltransferase
VDPEAGPAPGGKPTNDSPGLPADFSLVLDRALHRPRPDLLIGGYPARILRLRPAGVNVIDGWVAGGPVGSRPRAQSLARRLVDAGMAHPRPPPRGHPAACVTVVIPVRDRADGLAATLAAVDAEQPIIVVDDGSETPVRADAVRVIRHGAGRGPAAARNTGWRAAGGDLVAFVDADCQPSPGWLEPLLPHFADPAVGAVAPRITSHAAPGTPAALTTYDRHRSPLDLGGQEAQVRPRGRVPYVPGAALVVRRQALVHIGGFDDALRYGEDVDLVWRLSEHGWRVRYQPSVTVSHPVRAGFAPWLRQRYQYGRSAAPLAARHPRAVAPVVVSPWTAAAWALAVSGHPGLGSGVAAASGVALVHRARGDRVAARTLARLALRGPASGGAALADATRRTWVPPAVAVSALAARLGRRGPALALGAALVAPPLVEWVRSRPDQLGLGAWSALRLIDDLAYQTGVWAGVIETRRGGALLPDYRLNEW